MVKKSEIYKKLWNVFIIAAVLFTTACTNTKVGADINQEETSHVVQSESAPTIQDTEIQETVREIPEDSSPEEFARLENLLPYQVNKNERYYSQTMLGLVPQKDYGKIYPYLGQVNQGIEDEYSYIKYTGYFYGFIDQYGKIICDPNYNNVHLLHYKDKSAYSLHKYTYAAGTHEEIGYNAVVSADGSFVEKYERVYIRSESFQYIPVMKNGKWGVIDYDGTEVLPCIYDNAPLFQDDMAAVLDDSSTYYYINPSGERIMGPFEAPPRLYFETDAGYYPEGLESALFYNNRAMYFKDGKYGFMDKNQVQITPPIYIYTSHSSDGYSIDQYAIVREGDSYPSSYSVIDLSGNYVVPPQEAPIYRVEAKYFVVYDEDYNISYTYNKAAPLDAESQYLGGGYVGKSLGEGEYMLSRGWQSKTFKANTAERICGDLFQLKDGTDAGVVNIEGRRYLNNGEGLRKIADLDYSDGVICIKYQMGSGNPYVSGYGKLKYGVVGNDGVLLDFRYSYLEEMGEYFCAAEGNYGGLIDRSGNWIIKVSLLDHLDD